MSQSATDPIVIVSAARTPIGGFQGVLAGVPAPELGAAAIKAAVARAGIDGDEVAEVLMGCVLPAGLGQAPARQAARGAGLPDHVPATTVNKMCGSGMKTVMLAYEALHARPRDVIVAGGMESMTNAPYLLPKMRSWRPARSRRGQGPHVRRRSGGRLRRADRLMGTYAEDTAQAYQFTREAQDRFAIESLRRAKAANEDGSFAREIAPMTVKTRKGAVEVVARRAAVHGRPGEDPDLEAGVPRRRHGDAGQLELDLGWGGSARADARKRGQPAQARAARAHRGGRHACAGAGLVHDSAGRCHQEGARSQPAGARRTSVSTRSTRHSRS